MWRKTESKIFSLHGSPASEKYLTLDQVFKNSLPNQFVKSIFRTNLKQKKINIYVVHELQTF